MNGAAAATRGRLIGSWRLVDTWREAVAGGAREAQLGPAPRGAITYAPEGRMMALVTRGDRPAPRTEAERAALYAAMVAYAGRWEVTPDGGAVRHHLEVAWQPGLVGGTFLRHVSFEADGRRMTLRSPPGPSAMDGVEAVVTIVWEQA